MSALSLSGGAVAGAACPTAAALTAALDSAVRGSRSGGLWIPLASHSSARRLVSVVADGAAVSEPVAGMGDVMSSSGPSLATRDINLHGGAARAVAASPVVIARSIRTALDGSLLKTKLDEIGQILTVLSAPEISSISVNQLSNDSLKRCAVERIIEIAAEDVVAVCHNLVSDDERRCTAEEVVAACIAPPSAPSFLELVRARNVLAHQYEQVTPEMLRGWLNVLGCVAEFRAAVSSLGVRCGAGSLVGGAAALLRQHVAMPEPEVSARRDGPPAFSQPIDIGLSPQGSVASQHGALPAILNDVETMLTAQQGMGGGAAPAQGRQSLDARIDARLILMKDLLRAIASWGIKSVEQIRRNQIVRKALERSLETLMQLMVDLSKDLLVRSNVRCIARFKRDVIKKCEDLLMNSGGGVYMPGRRYADVVYSRNNLAHYSECLGAIDIWTAYVRHFDTIKYFCGGVEGHLRQSRLDQAGQAIIQANPKTPEAAAVTNVSLLAASSGLPGPASIAPLGAAGDTVIAEPAGPDLIAAAIDPQPEWSAAAAGKKSVAVSLAGVEYRFRSKGVAPEEVRVVSVIIDELWQAAFEGVRTTAESAREALNIAKQMVDNYLQVYLRVYGKNGELAATARSIADAATKSCLKIFQEARGRAFCSQDACTIARAGLEDYVELYWTICHSEPTLTTSDVLPITSMIFDKWYLDGYCEVYNVRKDVAVRARHAAAAAVFVYAATYYSVADENNLNEAREYAESVTSDYVGEFCKICFRNSPLDRDCVMAHAADVAGLFCDVYTVARSAEVPHGVAANICRDALEMICAHYKRMAAPEDEGRVLSFDEISGGVISYAQAFVNWWEHVRKRCAPGADDMANVQRQAMLAAGIAVDLHCQFSPKLYDEDRKLERDEARRVVEAMGERLHAAFWVVRDLPNAQEREAFQVACCCVSDAMGSVCTLLREYKVTVPQGVDALGEIVACQLSCYRDTRQRGLDHHEAMDVCRNVAARYSEVYRSCLTADGQVNCGAARQAARQYTEKMLRAFCLMRFEGGVPLGECMTAILSLAAKYSTLVALARERAVNSTVATELRADMVVRLAEAYTRVHKALQVGVREVFEISSLTVMVWFDLCCVKLVDGVSLARAEEYANAGAMVPTGVYLAARRSGGKSHTEAMGLVSQRISSLAANVADHLGVPGPRHR